MILIGRRTVISQHFSLHLRSKCVSNVGAPWQASGGNSVQDLCEWFQGLAGASEILRQGLAGDLQD